MKKWLEVGVLLLFLCTLILGIAKNAVISEEISPEKTYKELVILLPGEEPQNWDDTQERLNEIFQKEANVEVKFIFEDIDLLKNTASRMLVGNQQLDLMIVAGEGSFQQFLTAGQLLELNDLLEENGQAILNVTEPALLNECSMQGEIYGIPSQFNYGIVENCWIFNKEILERNHISPEDITGMEQLENAFATVHQNEPTITVVQTMNSGFLSNLQYFSDDETVPIGVIMEEKETEYVNLFTTDYYRKNVERIHQWFQNGYMIVADGDMYSNTYTEMAEGNLLAYPVQGKPGILEQETEKCHDADFLCLISLGEAVKPGEFGSKCPWAITVNTIDEKKAMEVLRLIYVNEEIAQLLDLENLNGVSSIKNDAFRQEIQQFNEKCHEMPDTGFYFDITNVYAEYLECVEIYSKYKPLLEIGLVDVEEALTEMNRELEQAGIDKIIQEKNVQYHNFLNNK